MARGNSGPKVEAMKMTSRFFLSVVAAAGILAIAAAPARASVLTLENWAGAPPQDQLIASMVLYTTAEPADIDPDQFLISVASTIANWTGTDLSNNWAWRWDTTLVSPGYSFLDAVVFASADYPVGDLTALFNGVNIQICQPTGNPCNPIYESFVLGGFPTNPSFTPDSSFEVVVPSPEPASFCFLGIGLAGFGFLRKRRSH
jgi:hypothetical protein